MVHLGRCRMKNGSVKLRYWQLNRVTTCTVFGCCGAGGGIAAAGAERPKSSIIAMAKIVPPPKAIAYLIGAGNGGMGSVVPASVGIMVSSGASLFMG